MHVNFYGTVQVKQISLWQCMFSLQIKKIFTIWNDVLFWNKYHTLKYLITIKDRYNVCQTFIIFDLATFLRQMILNMIHLFILNRKTMIKILLIWNPLVCHVDSAVFLGLFVHSDCLTDAPWNPSFCLINLYLSLSNVKWQIMLPLRIEIVSRFETMFWLIHVLQMFLVNMLH